jgi:hypothetical protein
MMDYMNQIGGDFGVSAIFCIAPQKRQQIAVEEIDEAVAEFRDNGRASQHACIQHPGRIVPHPWCVITQTGEQEEFVFFRRSADARDDRSESSAKFELLLEEKQQLTARCGAKQVCLLLEDLDRFRPEAKVQERPKQVCRDTGVVRSDSRERVQDSRAWHSLRQSLMEGDKRGDGLFRSRSDLLESADNPSLKREGFGPAKALQQSRNGRLRSRTCGGKFLRGAAMQID